MDKLPDGNPRIGCTKDGLEKLEAAYNAKKKETGMSDEKIAEECDINLSTLKRFRSGKCHVYLANAVQILKYLGLEENPCEILDCSQVNNRRNAPGNHAKNSDVVNKLKKLLIELNYKEQYTQFSSWREQRYKTGAFIIEGKPKRGQRWLVNRLLQQKFREPYEIDNLIPLMKPTSSKKSEEDYDEFYPDEMWKELARSLGLGSKANAEKCVERAFQRWENDNLILAVYTDKIYEGIPLLIKEFWQPLIEKVSQNQENESYLLMFLIDSSDRASQWRSDTVFSDNLTNGHPQQPISLPRIETLGKKCYDSWFEDNRNFLGCPRNTQDEQNKLQNVSKTIWDKTKGIPEDVFKQICQRCGCNWSDIEATLKL
jgi:transcriptional regulator with XRE-family HTH domain